MLGYSLISGARAGSGFTSPPASRSLAAMLGGSDLAGRLRRRWPLENIGPMAPLRRWLSSHAKDRDDRACPAEDKSAPSDHKPVPLDDPVRLLDDMSKEYYAIVEVVSGFDQRLMTIKGWSVTLSLAALGLGFQQGHYALFALAAATAGGFWYVDPLNKGFQTRYYGRMRDIEVAAHALNHVNIALKRKPETSPETYPGVPPKSWEFWKSPTGSWTSESPQTSPCRRPESTGAGHSMETRPTVSGATIHRSVAHRRKFVSASAGRGYCRT